jgi:hypothetical protein
MPLELQLTPELELRLESESRRLARPPETVAIELLEQHLPKPMIDDDARRAAALALLAKWQEEDLALTAEEEQENLEVLRAFDADRPSYRKLFENYLKDDPK